MFTSPRLPYPVPLKILLEVNQTPYNLWVLTDAYQHGTYLRSEEYIEKMRRQDTSLPQLLSDVKPFRVLTIIHTHANSHAFVEQVENGQHLLWYTEACEQNSK